LPISVRSLIAQTHRPLQVIVVDDGSADDTPNVLETLAGEARDAGVEPSFIRQDNAGASAARNRGLKEVRGEFFGFLDDDDSWYPEKAALQVEALRASGAGACSSLALWIRDNGYHVVPEPGQRLLVGRDPGAHIRAETHAHINSLLVRASLIEKVGEFELTLRISQDIDWLARLAHEAEFTCVERVLIRYDTTVAGDALTNFSTFRQLLAHDEDVERMVQSIREKCSGRPGWDEEAWRFRAGRSFRAYVQHLLKARDFGRALEVYRRGLEVSCEHSFLTRMAGRMRRAKRQALWARLTGAKPVDPETEVRP